MPSDSPTDGRCNAETRDGGYCQSYPVQGSERCRMHGGTAPTGEDCPAYEHGGFSEYLASDLTDDEAAALDVLAKDLADPDEARERIRQQAAEAYLKYKRSGDERFLREYRQLLSTFNIVEAPDQVEVEHSGEIDGERTLGDDELAAIREGLAASGGSDA